MPYPESLETDRLSLRRWTLDDRAAVDAIWRERDVWSVLRPNLPFDPDAGRDMLDRHVGHWDRHGFGLWTVTVRPADEIIGWVGASHPTFIGELADRIEIGWTMRPSHWGRGIATEGGAAAIDAVFEHLETDEVISLIQDSNARSVAVAERLGMRHARDVLHPKLGADLRVYALSLSAWRSSSSRGASAQSTSSR
jgi:RimJ/RimL family protein N-acetyltransferase